MTSLPVWVHSERSADDIAYQPVGDSEQARAARLISPETAQNFLHARNVMRKLVADECGLAADEVQLRAYDDARSSVKGIDKISVSWSRSGPHAFAALLRDGRVGADIEQLRPLNTGPVLQMIANEDERRVLEPLGNGDAALCGFYRLWCAKEAVLKWRGKGLRGGPKSVVVPGPFISGEKPDMDFEEAGRQVHLKAIQPSDDWVAVLAFSG